MREKSEFTIVERALQTVDGFQKVFYTLQQQTILRGQSVSTLNNYIRQVALNSLHSTNFRKILRKKRSTSTSPPWPKAPNLHPEAVLNMPFMAYVTISDIDFERKTIHIRQSKYKKDRIVSLSKYMEKGLKQYIAVENPHIHCIVPAAGLTLAGNLKHITKQGKYLYPVRMLSAVFRGKMLEKLKRQLKQSKHLPQYQSLLDDLWRKPWVVYCEPPLENSRQIVKYLGQYSHR